MALRELQHLTNPRRRPGIHRRALNRPGDRALQGVPQDRPTGFADGGQRHASPLTRTALAQRGDEQTVRQQDEVEMPGLALAAAQLTVAHPEVLLAVPMEGLGPCPALAVDSQNPR